MFLMAGGGSAAFPLARAKNPWLLLPYPVVCWFAARPEFLDQYQQRQILAALLRPRLSLAQYRTLVGVQVHLLRNPTAWGFQDILEYSIGKARAAPDGSVVVGKEGKGFVWHLHNETENTYSMLSDRGAVALADALVYRWRMDLTFGGDQAGRELWVLAYWHPAVGDHALAKLFQEPTEWMVYALDPRSKQGEAFRALLRAYQGTDPERRARAAAVLTDSYFAVNTHWEAPPSLAWIQQQYPEFDELTAAAEPAADELLRLARTETGEHQRGAVLSLAWAWPMWSEQSIELYHTHDGLAPDLRRCLEGNRPQKP